jgi:hypothetical protein
VRNANIRKDALVVVDREISGAARLPQPGNLSRRSAVRAMLVSTAPTIRLF